MTFDEWWEKPTDGWYLGRMASGDEKRYAQAAWDAAILSEREVSAKVTVRIDYKDGTHTVSEIDHHGPKPPSVE